MPRWPISDEAAREMYIGGRGDAHRLVGTRGLWKLVFAIGVLPHGG